MFAPRILILRAPGSNCDAETASRMWQEAVARLMPASVPTPAGTVYEEATVISMAGPGKYMIQFKDQRIRVQKWSDTRTLDVRVAGPAALLVAKVHKIDDRKDSDRQSDKDALDVLRLLRGTETDDLVARYAKLLGDKRSEEAALRGQDLLEAQFAKRQNIGVQMAIRSAGALGDTDEISVLFEALVNDFLFALR